MIGLASRVRLASKARLRHDPRSGKQILLYPERGLELSETAARIAGLCQTERAVSAIVDALVVEASGASRGQIEADVLTFLGELERRGLLVQEGGT